MVQQFEANKSKALEESGALYQAGLGLFQSGDIMQAEKCFVSAVRPFLSKNTMQNIYVKVEDFADSLLDSMYYMGLIYLQDNEKTYSDSYSKAAAIFQYCHKFQEKYKIPKESEIGKVDFLKEAYLAEEKFLSSLGIKPYEDRATEEVASEAALAESVKAEDVHYKSKIAEYEGYKKELTGIREVMGQRLEEISSPGIDQIEKRAEAVRKLYEQSTDFFVNTEKGLLKGLIEDCKKQLGPAPCEYSLVGLGSLAVGKMTPWSDLEFMIITADDQYKQSENPNIKEYFRNLTKLLHIKVINLGETPLRSVGIESFNNFKTGEASDEWFWDSVIMNGFSFDGPDSHACKTPLGRQGGYQIKRKIVDESTGVKKEAKKTEVDYELIMTTQELARLQLDSSEKNNNAIDFTEGDAVAKEEQRVDMKEEQEGINFESDPILVQCLRSTILIDGSQELLDGYRNIIRNTDEKSTQTRKDNSLKLLKEYVGDFELKLKENDQGKLFDVKKSIYRVADRLIDTLANYYGILPEEGKTYLSSWEAIVILARDSKIDSKGAQKLKEALSIATELRLVAYRHNEDQSEGLSTYRPAVDDLDEGRRKELIEKTFHVKDTSLLHHFYYIMVRFQKLCSDLSYSKDYPEELASNEEILSKDKIFDNSDHTKYLVHARFLEFESAIKYIERYAAEHPHDLDLMEEQYFLYCQAGKIADSLKSARNYLETIEKEGVANLAKITLLGVGEDDWLFLTEEQFKSLCYAMACTRIGTSLFNKGEYVTSKEFYALSLAIVKEHSIEDHPEVFNCYAGLANFDIREGNYREALDHLNEAHKIAKKYEDSEKLAVVYSKYAVTYQKQGNDSSAEEYYEKSLSESQVIHKDNPNHPDFADTHTNLGTLYRMQGKLENAIKHHQQALAMYEVFYRETPDNMAIAQCHINLGVVYNKWEKYPEAMRSLELAEEIINRLLPKGNKNDETTKLYSAMAFCYAGMKQYPEAAEYYEKVLEVRLETLPKNHPDIGLVYESLANVCLSLGYYEKCFSYKLKQLQIIKSSHGEGSKEYTSCQFELDLICAYRKESFEHVYKPVLQNLAGTPDDQIKEKILQTLRELKANGKISGKADVEIEISMQGLSQEDLIEYSMQQLHLDTVNLEFDGQFCSITLEPNTLEILGCV